MNKTERESFTFGYKMPLEYDSKQIHRPTESTRDLYSQSENARNLIDFVRVADVIVCSRKVVTIHSEC